MATFNDMIDEVLINLAGYTLQQDRTTYLRTPITTLTSPSTSPLIVSLGSTESVGKGVIEINDELLWVDGFDKINNTATVAPYGRGYLGTTAATHEPDTKVTISPTFPRYIVKKAINDTIRAIGATIFAVKQTNFIFNSAVNTYDFDNLNIQNILTMMWQDTGSSREWIRIRRYDFDPLADTGTWGNNSQTVTVYDYITPGRTVKVMYATAPASFTDINQEFNIQTGLPESCKDVVILGAAYRLLAYLDPARAAMVSPQADEIDSRRPFGASQSAMKQLYALFAQRLSEETQAQQQQYPPRIRYSR